MNTFACPGAGPGRAGPVTWLRGLAALTLMTIAGVCAAHASPLPADAQVRAFLDGLDAQARGRAVFRFDDEERYRFRWTPGQREGVRLAALDPHQREALRVFFHTVLSDAGTRKVDAILATEAALGVIEGSPAYRDPEKYWTAVFGTPGSQPWGLRFEGHHLSVNLTFRGAELIAATPLFLGANPERIPSGPDEGLRALAGEVDLAWALYEGLDDDARAAARGAGEWFGGFLTTAGQRRADLGKPAGIAATALPPAQQAQLRALIAVYVETVATSYAAPYLARVFEEEWASLRFHWAGAEARGDSYYYRIAGTRVLIEHDNRSGGSHVHAIWRDRVHDFGGM